MGTFRTRVVREGVIPSLYVDYKSSRLKQYFKGGRALRTELTVNDAGEFDLGRKLDNLPALRELGFRATRRLLDVEKTSQDFAFSEEVFREVTGPCRVGEQRASALRFGDELVQALLSVLLVLRLLPRGFRSGDLREHLASLLGVDPSQWTQGRLTYQLRRLRLHGLIEPRGDLRGGVPRRHSAAPRSRPFRSRGEPIYRESESSCGGLTKKLDPSAPNLPLKGV
jgi:hypothetical protein